MLRRAQFSALVVTLVAGLAGAAHADEPPASVTPMPPPGSYGWQTPPATWYGWQTLAADAATAATWIAADETGSSKLAALGALVYLAGTPVIHAENGHPLSAVTSVGLRVIAPLLGAIVGISVDSRCTNPTADEEIPSLSPCEAQGAAVGFFGAMVAVSIFDAARAVTKPGEARWRPHREPGLAWAPAVTPTGTGTTFGLVGIF